jgi:short-subunit dehydrogenase
MDATRYGPWCLIAGGSEGVGAAFAHKLAASGINLVLVARKPEPLAEVADEIRRTSRITVRTLPLDLSANDAVDRIKAETADIEIGLLIYNAGAESRLANFVERDQADATNMIARNITVPTILAHHFGAGMKARGRGGIILVGAVGGYAGGPGMAMYAASKAFDYILAEGLWYELKPHGVDVLGLILGATDTPALARIGMRTDTPGFVAADAAEVAQEGLDHLGQGPIRHTGGTEATAQHLRAMPRAEAVTLIAQSSKAMMKS